MTVDADEIYFRGRRAAQLPSYRGEFNLNSEGKTREAARFAAQLLQAARPLIAPRHRARLGLLGDFDVGKTTFSNAFVEALGAEPQIEPRGPLTGLRMTGGLILHGDANHIFERPYFTTDEEGYDICEGAEDAPDRNFDLVLHLKPGASETERVMMLFADDDIAGTEAFAAFRVSLEHLEAAP